MDLQTSIPQQLDALLGPGTVVAWEDLPEADRLTFQAAIAAGRTAPNPDAIAPAIDRPTCLVSPPNVEALQTVVQCAHRNHWPLLVTGSHSKIGWGAPVQGAKLILSTAQLTQWVDHAVGDLTLTAEAGVSLATAQSRLGDQGQFLALDPLYSGTLGGLVATGEAGPLRQRYGGVRDMVLGVEFVRSDGEKAKAGGRVVKNVAGYDLMKLLSGSHGSLGIITQLTLRLYPRPEQFQTQILWGDGATVALLAQKILASTLSPVAIEVGSHSLLMALGITAQAGDLGLFLRFGTLASSNQEQMAEIATLGTNLGLKFQNFGPDLEADLWGKMQCALQQGVPQGDGADGPIAASDDRLLLKLGIPPSQIGATFALLGSSLPETALIRLQAGSGLGYLRCTAQEMGTNALAQLRTHCQQQGGFLTVLEGPRSLKAADPWGYGGNALGLMQGIKRQFDPTGLLNPGRSLGG